MRQNACGNYSLDMRRSLRSSTYRNQRPAPRPSWRSRLPPPSSPSRRTARTPKWLQQTIRHHQHLTGGGSGYSPERVRQTATASIQRIGVAEQIAAGPASNTPCVAIVLLAGRSRCRRRSPQFRSPPARGTHQGPRGETVASAARRCWTRFAAGLKARSRRGSRESWPPALGGALSPLSLARARRLSQPSSWHCETVAAVIRLLQVGTVPYLLR